MNKILPGLYIGGIRDSRNHEQLSEHRITHILSIHDTAKSGTAPGVLYLCISAADSPTQNLAQYFPQCNDFIHSARQSGGSVLIHCLAGVSRSVTILAAYLMSITNLNCKQTLDAVRAVRTISEPNPGFQRQLHDFENFKLKQERIRLAYRFPGQLPSKADEAELNRLLGVNSQVAQQNLTPQSELKRKFIFFYSDATPSALNSN